MWFATQYGLNRYDGYSYKIFTHDAARETSLNLSVYPCTVQGSVRHGRVGCDRFLDRYDAATETFTHYRIGNRRDDQPPVHVFNLSQDRTDAIWLSTDDGLYRLDSKLGLIAHFGHDVSNPASLSSNDVHMTGEDRDGRFWVSDGGLIEEFTGAPRASCSGLGSPTTHHHFARPLSRRSLRPVLGNVRD